MQLYLIRHAGSENNSRPPYQRVEDPPITAVGRLQAQHLGQWVRTLKVDTLITSPFRRTLQTTTWITNESPQTVFVWHDLFEHGGCFRGYGPDATGGAMGMGRAEILEHFREENVPCEVDDTIGDDGWWGGQPRENDHQVAVRCRNVTKRFIDTFGSNGQTIVAVTHADFKRRLLHVMLDNTADPAGFGPMRNTGITKLNYDGERWQLDWLNSISHLPARLITGNEQ